MPAHTFINSWLIDQIGRHSRGIFFMKQKGKRVSRSRDGYWSPPLIDMSYTKKSAYALPKILLLIVILLLDTTLAALAPISARLTYTQLCTKKIILRAREITTAAWSVLDVRMPHHKGFRRELRKLRKQAFTVTKKFLNIDKCTQNREKLFLILSYLPSQREREREREYWVRGLNISFCNSFLVCHQNAFMPT